MPAREANTAQKRVAVREFPLEGKPMCAVRVTRKRLHADDVRGRNLSVDMWKRIAAPRGLPTNRFSQGFLVNRDNHQSVLADEVLGHRFDNLLAAGKMDEAVLEIDSRASEDTFNFSRFPDIGGQNFVEQTTQFGTCVAKEGKTRF